MLPSRGPSRDEPDCERRARPDSLQAVPSMRPAARIPVPSRRPSRQRRPGFDPECGAGTPVLDVDGGCGSYRPTTPTTHSRRRRHRRVDKSPISHWVNEMRRSSHGHRDRLHTRAPDAPHTRRAVCPPRTPRGEADRFEGTPSHTPRPLQESGILVHRGAFASRALAAGHQCRQGVRHRCPAHHAAARFVGRQKALPSNALRRSCDPSPRRRLATPERRGLGSARVHWRPLARSACGSVLATALVSGACASRVHGRSL